MMIDNIDNKMLLLAAYIIYAGVLIYTIGKILLFTKSTPKTLAYILLILVFPVVGIIVYYSFGINYRHHKTMSEAKKSQDSVNAGYKVLLENNTAKLIEESDGSFYQFLPLIDFVNELGNEVLSQNKVKLLVNGEVKFPEVLSELADAKQFIHMEYYDWENDTRGNQIKEILQKKITEGIKVRILYDDYASRKIKHNIVKELKNSGAEIYPRIKVKFRQFANRVNHRDHRKLIIIDNVTGFVGGINISDRYDNSIDTGLYWRDTHVKITGPVVSSLQRHFIVSWNSASKEDLLVSEELFPKVKPGTGEGLPAIAQIVAGGPIYPNSNIMLSYVRIFSLAREKLYITNPYFIPSESIMNALVQAAISGVDVRLLVPEKSDSAIVGAASKFYFEDLLAAGVRIFLYKKGFVHAKTVVADSVLSVVGTANMDIRSFDLNFEIMSVMYGKEMAGELEAAFMNDLENADEVKKENWFKTGVGKQLVYAVARLISSFL